jgi:integrase
MGLGGYPEISLKDARDLAREARRKLREGIDPIEDRRAAKQALLAASARALTFKEAAEQYIADQEAGWKNPKHRQQWRNTLKAYVYPKMGALPVAGVEVPHVLDALRPIWTEKTETASRLRGRIELVLDWATARGYRQGLNPARWRGHLDKLLPRPSKVSHSQHHDALPVGEVGAFMVRLRAAEGLGSKALELAILTAARSGEVRGAAWSEIDLRARTWTIPSARMKAGKEHRVPLSQAAVDLLGKLPRMAGTDLVFAAPRGGQLSDMTLSAVVRRMEDRPAATPHGFRSTFRDWVSERTAYPGDMAEMALAHAIGSKVEAAYRRGDMFERRRRLMEDWAAFLAKPEVSSNVVAPIRGAAQ